MSPSEKISNERAMTREVTASENAQVGFTYIANHATVLVVLTLPTTAKVGDTIRVIGKGAAGWKIGQNAGQSIRAISTTSTVGTDGSLAGTTNAYDNCEIVCTTDGGTVWKVFSSVGTMTVV